MNDISEHADLKGYNLYNRIMSEFEFTCKRCGYTTDFKCNLKKHLNKKKICISEDPNAPSSKEILEELCPVKDTPKFICTCGKEYSQKSSLYRHNKNCDKYQKYQTLVKTVKELRQDIKMLKRQNKKIDNNANASYNIMNVTNNNNNSNNTINNTIVVNNFGEEDISHLSPRFLENCLYLMSHGFKDLTRAIHLDKNKPENHTIQVTNIKSPYVKVRKDGKWIYKNRNEAINDLIWKENQILKSHYEENETDIRKRWKEQKLEIVKRWLDKLDDEDEEMWKRLKEDNFLLLINNKEVILKNESDNQGIVSGGT